MAEALAVLGLVTAIVQLVDFSAKVLNRLDDFATSIKEVPRAFRHIKTELPLITDSLRRIQDQAKASNVEAATITAITAVIVDCKRDIERLEIFLDHIVPSVGDSSWNRKKKALLSLSKEKEVEEISKSLERYVRVLTLHQAIEGAKPEQSPQPTKPISSQSFILIPFDRNANFVEREDVFKQIDDSFNVKEGSQPKAALFGLGGIGKSQISLEYAFSLKKRDPEYSIFWVQAATVARFEESYKRIATECGLVTREGSQVDTIPLVQNWLENRHNGRWLMVVDNVDDDDIFFRESTSNGKMISQCIPRTEKGSLLFTTRSRDIAIDLILPQPPIRVPSLTTHEGELLLRTRVPGELDEHAVELLEELENIPLAITQAAAFMSKRRKTIPQYLDLYRKSDSTRLRMLNYEFSDHGRQHNSMESVAKTWMVSFESIRRLNPRAADLLLLMSHFDRHSIPSALLQNEEEDGFDFEEAVAILCAFSFIEADEEGTTFEMHSLVQLATKLWNAEENKGEEKDHWAFEALTSLAEKFPAPENNFTKEYVTTCSVILPHAQSILVYPFMGSKEDIELARATVLLSVARFINKRGAYIESVTKTEECLEIRRRILGERHYDTLRALGQLVWVLYIIGRTSESAKLGKVCFELRREILGDEHPETIDSLSDLAAALEGEGDLEVSERMQRQAYEASVRILGPEHHDTQNCLGHLASVLEEQGKLDEAEVALRKLISLEDKNTGDGTRQHNLALTLVKQSNFEEAEEWYRLSLDMKQKLHGKCHTETIVTLANYVVLLGRQRKWDQIDILSGWFSGEPLEAYKMQENGNETLKTSLRFLNSWGVDVSSSVSSFPDGGSNEGSDEGYEGSDKGSDKHSV